MPETPPRHRTLPILAVVVGGAIWTLGLLVLGMHSGSGSEMPSDTWRWTALWVGVGAAGAGIGMRWLRSGPTDTSAGQRVVGWGIAGGVGAMGALMAVMALVVALLGWLLSGMH